jgi:hypothetical protein
MPFNISNFKASGLKLGGARPSLFEVRIPRLGSGSEFLVQAAQIPSATIGPVEVPYFGRKIKLAGDRTYVEWTTTVLNDEDFAIRNALEDWAQGINGNVGNTRTDPDYKQDGTVIQYAKNGNQLREYKFIGLFPSEISTIELDWNTVDTVETFTVTWQYDYWELV